jgi:hypothetical protein
MFTSASKRRRDDLRASLQTAWDSLPQTVIDKSIGQLRGRLRVMIQARGGPFEHRM